MPAADDSEQWGVLRLFDVELEWGHKRKYGRRSPQGARLSELLGTFPKMDTDFPFSSLQLPCSCTLPCRRAGSTRESLQCFPRRISVLEAFQCTPPWEGPSLWSPVLGRQQGLSNRDPDSEPGARDTAGSSQNTRGSRLHPPHIVS